ncbi:MAG: hypothetical protein V3S69_05760 [Dehalococcoidales bacterium]
MKFIWKALWWCSVVLPLFAGFRWVMSTYHLLLHRLFRSSAGVRKKQKKAYDNFFERRSEEVLEHQYEIYPFLSSIMEKQSSRYISIETIRALQSLMLVDTATVFTLMDVNRYHIIDLEGVQVEMGHRFEREHFTEERTPKYEKMIARDYGGEQHDSAEAIGDLVSVLMASDAACAPTLDGFWKEPASTGTRPFPG